MSKKKEPIRGASFNVYAIVGLLIITPVYIALITNFAQASGIDEKIEVLPMDGELETNYNLIDPDNPSLGYDGFNPGGYLRNNGNSVLFNWINIGDNLTSEYQSHLGTDIYEFNCFWLYETYPLFGHPDNFDIQGLNYSYYVQESAPGPFDRTGCHRGPAATNSGAIGNSLTMVAIDNNHYALVADNHAWLNVAANNSRSYIGYSGNEFSFSLENPIWQHFEDERTINSIDIKMMDAAGQYNQAGIFACDQIQSSNIEFDYSLEVYHKPGEKSTHETTVGLPIYTFDGYQYDGDNIMERTNPFFGANIPDVACSYGFTLEYDFTVWQAMELKSIQEAYGSWENFSAIVKIKNMKNTDNPNGILATTGLPFAGDGGFYLSVQATYSNPSTTNFLLKGGALLGGIGLFFLAIASTPYYDPVRNFFSGAIE